MKHLSENRSRESGGGLLLARPACPAPQSFGFFDGELRVPWRLTQGNPWSRLEAVLDGELFRPLRDAAGDQPAQGPGGRPPPDRLKRFQPPGGQRFYNLSDEQQESHRQKSKIRVRIEPIFGHLSQRLKGFYRRAMGRRRPAAASGLINRIDPLARDEPIVRLK